MKRLALMIFFVLACGVVLTNCEKEIDYTKLEGTAWETEANEDGFYYLLRFVDDSTSILVPMLKGDSSFIAHPAIFSWRYNLAIDSWRGLFCIYRNNEDGEYFFRTGYVEDKRLYLNFQDMTTHCFKRKK